MSDASEADRQEQSQSAAPGDDVVDDDILDAVAKPPLEPEAPVEDAIEQRLPVPGADEEYDQP